MWQEFVRQLAAVGLLFLLLLVVALQMTFGKSEREW